MYPQIFIFQIWILLKFLETDVFNEVFKQNVQPIQATRTCQCRDLLCEHRTSPGVKLMSLCTKFNG